MLGVLSSIVQHQDHKVSCHPLFRSNTPVYTMPQLSSSFCTPPVRFTTFLLEAIRFRTERTENPLRSKNGWRVKSNKMLKNFDVSTVVVQRHVSPVAAQNKKKKSVGLRTAQCPGGPISGLPRSNCLRAYCVDNHKACAQLLWLFENTWTSLILSQRCLGLENIVGFYGFLHFERFVRKFTHNLV